MESKNESPLQKEIVRLIKKETSEIQLLEKVSGTTAEVVKQAHLFFLNDLKKLRALTATHRQQGMSKQSLRAEE